VALFVYGLLPIVTNAHQGLVDIPPALRESAIVLGLTERERLTFVELPLAARSILAGMRTSAVVAVGTATVAAFAGAGGFGQPISTGLNLNDTTTILSGAIPAALLALAVGAVFSAIDRRLARKLGVERG
jgi:osmoprotectant transport system permease protein